MGKVVAQRRRCEEVRPSAPSSAVPAHRPSPPWISQAPAPRESRLMLPERGAPATPAPNPATAAVQRRLQGDRTLPRDSPAAQTAPESSLARRLVSPRRNDAIPAGAAPAVIQRVERRVKKGAVADWTWQHLRTEGDWDYYDDKQPSNPVNDLAPTRDVADEIDYDALSDPELSGNELDVDRPTKKQIYRVKNIRDALKLREKILAKNPTKSYGARIGEGGTVFRLTGSKSQVKIQAVKPDRLIQSDKTTQASGGMPEREKSDRNASGSTGSYEHVASELLNYSSTDIGQALKGRFFDEPSVPYPNTFSKRAKAKLDEMMAILGIAEPFRTRYAMNLFAGVVGALINGESLKDVLYKGTGQIEALHPGASGLKRSGVSGQLMEQNIGKGKNDPHPTQNQMNLSDTAFNNGVKRTHTLFEKARKTGQSQYKFLDEYLEPTLRKQMKK